MNLKIKEIFRDKNTLEEKFLLDADGQIVVVYATKHGYQIIGEFTNEQITEMHLFLKEFYNTIK